MKANNLFYSSRISLKFEYSAFFLIILAFIGNTVTGKCPSKKNVDMLTSDGAWCWFGDPRAVYHYGTKEQTYFGWITSEGDIMINCYDHKTGEFKNSVIHKDLEADDHDNPSIFIRKDGRIIVLYSKHSHGPMYRVISDKPEDISLWCEATTFGKDVTYPNPFQVGDKIYLFYRGIQWHPTLIISEDNGVTWGNPQLIIKGGGARPYAKYAIDKKDGIHIAFTRGHPRVEPENVIFYIYYKNNTFINADGKIVKEFNGSNPLDIDSDIIDTVYDASNGKGWIWDITANDKGYPVIVYASFPKDDNHIYNYSCWTGSEWFNKKLTNGGSWFPQTPENQHEREPNYSGGISIDHDNPNIIYLSKPVNNIFEIWQWVTYDNGNNWISKQITSDSKPGSLNIRPFVPLNHKSGYFDVIWMHGTYVHYTDYNTSIMQYSHLK